MDREAWTIVWTIIGVGVALLGVLVPLNLYLVHSRTQALQDSLLLLITRVENRIDQLEQNRQADVARLEQNQQGLEQRLQAAMEKMESGLEAQLEAQRQELRAIGERTARIEGALTGPWNARNGETTSAPRMAPQEA